jgi:ATP-dependent RNA helicase SUPV3L1/SUV3
VQEKRSTRPHEQRGKGNPRGERNAGRKPERKLDHSGKPGSERDGRPPRTSRDNRPAPRPDTGPARAGGAFDKLADLLKG